LLGIDFLNGVPFFLNSRTGPQMVHRADMKTLIRLFRCLLALLVGAFSLFGFLASFEPTETFPVHLGWMIGYAVLLLACIGVFSNDARRLVRDAVRTGELR
jgi:hypothetical protein